MAKVKYLVLSLRRNIQNWRIRNLWRKEFGNQRIGRFLLFQLLGKVVMSFTYVGSFSIYMKNVLYENCLLLKFKNASTSLWKHLKIQFLEEDWEILHNYPAYNRQQNYSNICYNSLSEISYVTMFYEINICWVIIFSL